MEFREVRVFVAIADHGSVHRAAGALGMSPSAVSHTIRSLETRVGVALFRRLPRGMRLTSAGDAMLAPARRVLREGDAVLAAASEIKEMMAGSLGLVTSRVYMVPLAELLGTFAARYPRVVLRIANPETEADIVRLIRNGECELGVMRAAAVPPDFDPTPIEATETVVVVPEGHRLARRASVSLGDLVDEPMIAPPPSSRTREEFDQLFRERGLEPAVVAESGNHEMVLELVRVGVGCTLATSNSVATVVGSRGAVAVLLDDGPVSEYSFVSSRSAPLSRAAEAFLEHATGVTA